jgi:small-conductance mechanosensitive channel/CRP-like cAMP-binding protein
MATTRAIKNKLALFFVATAIVSLALYFLARPLRHYLASHMRSGSSPDSIVYIPELILWAILAYLAVRALNAIIFEFVFRVRKGYEAPTLVRNIFSIVAFILLFVLIFREIYPGVNLGALFTTSAIFGVIIGLALQDTLGNFFAGISLHADRPFQVGDVITVGQQQQLTGVLESITWRAVKIRTFQNKIVLVSNSTIAKEAIEVAPRDNLNARIVFFNSLYTDSPAKTIHIVREAVRDTENVSPKITPVVRIRDLAESGIDWEVKYWLEDYAKHHDTDALVRQRVWYAFRRAGIQFAFPTRTLHVERRALTIEDRGAGQDIVDRLTAVDIFAPLSDEETERLAAASVRHVFAPDELVIRAGDDGSSMFVVHSGRVQVQISENGKPRAVAVLNEGDFFGEMALFTGEPRAATVVALEETEVLEIGHTAMKLIFETNPDLVESLSWTIAERRAGLTATQQDAQVSIEESAGLLASIRRFFGLK